MYQLDPRVYSDWHFAKKEAGRIASMLRPAAVLLQTPSNGKRVLYSGKVVDCGTWLSCFCYLYQIYCDQNRQKVTQIVPTAQPWVGTLLGTPLMAIPID